MSLKCDIKYYLSILWRYLSIISAKLERYTTILLNVQPCQIRSNLNISRFLVVIKADLHHWKRIPVQSGQVLPCLNIEHMQDILTSQMYDRNVNFLVVKFNRWSFKILNLCISQYFKAIASFCFAIFSLTVESSNNLH